ncbi:MAG: sulfurtransferase [Pseudomonadales bacterium]|nr:sulfurtransferase [Pseudomonadales bacterium]
MYNTIIQANLLHSNLDTHNWILIDCRASLSNHNYGMKSYASYHIPGAQYANLEIDLSGPQIDGISGRHPLPERIKLTSFFQSLGIHNDSQIVAYDDGNSAFAARLWWLARWLGHETVAVLDGGLQSYKKYISEADTPAAAPVNDQRPFKSGFIAKPAISKTTSAEHLTRPISGRTLIDARAHKRFLGQEEPIDSFAGHIPGAICLPFEDNLDTDLRFKSSIALRNRFKPMITDQADVVCYCGSGITAAHNILAMQIAELAEATLYPGSWSEWIQDPSRNTEPARPLSS